jgi:large subunit ribosomal protein L10
MASKTREKTIPAYKIERVRQLAKAIQEHRTLLIASTHGLPSSQFHEIKKKLRGTAEVCVAKKSLVLRAIDATNSETLQGLKAEVGADVALFFSDLDPFALSGLLADNQSPTKARAGETAPEDIHVEPGPTDLVPGPAISELSGVGLKVAVEGGKLAIKQPHTIVKQGELIKENVASVMGKLGIMPMRVGFEPIAAYEAKEKKVYVGIKIDKKGMLEALREAIGKSRGFSISIMYLSPDTISHFIAKAGLEEKALQKLVNATSTAAPTTSGITGGAA